MPATITVYVRQAGAIFTLATKPDMSGTTTPITYKMEPVPLNAAGLQRARVWFDAQARASHMVPVFVGEEG